jgi:hypothetical protein
MFTIGAYKMTDVIDDSVKKIKNAQQDAEANAETTKEHAEGKPRSETLNKAKNQDKRPFELIIFCYY